MRYLFKFIIFVFYFSLSLSAANWQENLIKKIENKEFPSWMLEQIKEDLQPFAETGITKELLDTLELQDADNSCLVARYEIREGKLAVKSHESLKASDRYQKMLKTFEDLLICTSLPNVDFVLTLWDDISLFLKGSKRIDGPIFAFAKDKVQHKNVILIPDYDVLTDGQRQVREIEEARNSYPWDSKIPISFWRGSTTGATLTFTLNNFLNYPRYKLVYISFLYPKIIDARFNFLTQVDEELKEYLHKWGYIGNSLSIANHLRYKYQVLIDGNTCAYTRAYWQLFSNCMIFKQTSNNIQWYYRLLKDRVHYVPIAWDCSDLPEKIINLNHAALRILQFALTHESYTEF